MDFRLTDEDYLELEELGNRIPSAIALDIVPMKFYLKTQNTKIKVQLTYKQPILINIDRVITPDIECDSPITEQFQYCSTNQ